MTSLFIKITNQMIACLRASIEKDGRVWDQDPHALLEKFALCQETYDKYVQIYKQTKVSEEFLTLPSQPHTPVSLLQTELAQNVEGKQFDFSEVAIFNKIQ